MLHLFRGHSMNKIALTAVGLAAALTPAPPASADVPGLASFVGTWSGMRESVVIDETGHAHFHYMDMSACQNPCSMADMPYGTLDFVLTSVSNGVASGSVTAGSGTRNQQVGELVTVTLKPQPTGEAIGWTIGGRDEGLFCEHAIAAWCGG
jgi:hypothetical protein